MNNESIIGMNASFPFQGSEDIVNKLKFMNTEIPSNWEPHFQGFEVYEDNGDSVILAFINPDEYPLYDYLFEIDKSEIVKFSY